MPLMFHSQARKQWTHRLFRSLAFQVLAFQVPGLQVLALLEELPAQLDLAAKRTTKMLTQEGCVPGTSLW
jgi:hypothetical protein